MRDIEQAGFRACVKMLLEDAALVLHRQFVARERHHLAAKLEMEPVKRRAAEIFGMIHEGPAKRFTTAHPANRMSAPLSSDLRDFAPDHGPGLTPSVETENRPAFQKLIPPTRSFCLRVSGAVAPSAFVSHDESLPRGIV